MELACFCCCSTILAQQHRGVESSRQARRRWVLEAGPRPPRYYAFNALRGDEEHGRGTGGIRAVLARDTEAHIPYPAADAHLVRLHRGAVMVSKRK